MIDDVDLSSSTMRMLIGEALKNWSVDSLLKLLLDDDYVVRTSVARELQSRGDRRIYEEAILLLNDDRDFVREICAFLLGQLGTPSMPFRNETRERLVKMLSDKSSEVRGALVAALGHLSFDHMPEFVEEALILMSKDSDVEVRSCVAYALGNSSGSDLVVKTLNILINDRDTSVKSYAELGLEILKAK